MKQKTLGEISLLNFINSHRNIGEIVKTNNKATEQRLLQSIKELPKLEVKATTMHDWAFTEPIGELVEKQNENFKKLIL